LPDTVPPKLTLDQGSGVIVADVGDMVIEAACAALNGSIKQSNNQAVNIPVRRKPLFHSTAMTPPVCGAGRRGMLWPVELQIAYRVEAIKRCCVLKICHPAIQESTITL
jgi:hypothetical protein